MNRLDCILHLLGNWVNCQSSIGGPSALKDWSWTDWKTGQFTWLCQITCMWAVLVYATTVLGGGSAHILFSLNQAWLGQNLVIKGVWRLVFHSIMGKVDAAYGWAILVWQHLKLYYHTKQAIYIYARFSQILCMLYHPEKQTGKLSKNHSIVVAELCLCWNLA